MYLVAKLGGYEGFVKNFCVEEYVCVLNQNTLNTENSESNQSHDRKE